jgi:hypothetical protein
VPNAPSPSGSLLPRASVGALRRPSEHRRSQVPFLPQLRRISLRLCLTDLCCLNLGAQFLGVVLCSRQVALGTVEPVAQRVGALPFAGDRGFRPVCPAPLVGEHGDGLLDQCHGLPAVGVRSVGPPDGIICSLVRGAPVGLSLFCTGGQPGDLLGLSDRSIEGSNGWSLARSYSHVVRHHDQGATVVAGLGTPAEAARPKADCFGGEPVFLASLGVGKPLRRHRSEVG